MTPGEAKVIAAAIRWVKADRKFTTWRETHSIRHSWRWNRQKIREAVDSLLEERRAKP